MIGYSLWVGLGIALALLARRLQPAPAGLGARQRGALLLCAIGGAVLGAYLLQLPADLLGWSAPPPVGYEAPDAAPLGGVWGGCGAWFMPRMASAMTWPRPMPVPMPIPVPAAPPLGFCAASRMACPA